MYIYTMDNLEEELLNHINKCMDNIHINDDTIPQKPVENQPVEIPVDPDMKEPGSVRGELLTPVETYSEEELKKIARRDYITRVKIIALDNLGYKPLTNPKSLPRKDFNKVVKCCQEVINNLSEEEIINKFNDIVCNDILSEDTDVTNYPIYSNKIYA
jgi:hypothetical protein